MFKHRSQDKELLDQEDIPSVDLFQNLRELDFINHWLGGYNISFNALKKVIKPGESHILVDIGCGGGDTLKRIDNWNKKERHALDLYGVDIKPVCIAYAEENLKTAPVKLICDDYRHIFSHLKQVDIIHACLFCHHLTEEQLIELVRFALSSKAVLVINDLERNPFAYYSIKWLTQLFSKSYLVKNDAPLSVLRGFKRAEWLAILNKAGAIKYTVRNKWAFRHEVIVYGNAS
ncbi:methyltransferase domain-containing protein [Dyadobacter chenhuakuii]|uniref:Methyltransferase domain-containing protein n=1 Tax=Dyadobacter chenhuakuii TaxID=2909339 RepID=A0ABY4XRG2_9BACT|nr:methyltransferase domain-containing protein [Dyadobacter chenhuakuii]MCF2492732.1 methyltransferase domain-containing protein [Dyadobacter chenhuakuii]USJ32977.1 methyltransferase domain-containing protein [Dyadobacter chenhuakuii]